MYKLLIIIPVLVCAMSCVTKIKCPPFNTANLDWMPYSEGDTISFKSGKETKEYVIGLYKAYHSNDYPSNVTCWCYDRIELLFIGESDSLYIRFSYNNAPEGKDVFNSPAVICNRITSYRAEKKDNELALHYLNRHNDNRIVPDEIISYIAIKKDMGIVSFIRNKKEWKLREHKKCRMPSQIEIINKNAPSPT